MNKIYEWIDKVWQWIAKTVFVRFDFDLPTEQFVDLAKKGQLTFALTHGGFIEWLILSSWCRTQGLGAILIANRRRILLFSKPKYFFQVLFGRASYADLFLSKETGPRLLFCPSHERKEAFNPTPVEILLGEICAAGAASHTLGQFSLVPVLMLWRRHARGSARRLSEYLLGLYSNPNLIGKIWYLFRKRKDSTVRSLPPFTMTQKEGAEGVDSFEENEAMWMAKNARRKILIQINQEMRVLLGPRFLSPHLVKETLMRDPDIQRTIQEVAQFEKVDHKKVMGRAYQNLTEIVSNYQYRTIEVMYVLLTWVFNKIFDGFVSEEEQLTRIREVMKTKPVVFVSCHRSHLDYMVIPYVLFLHDMVTPHVAAGVNLAFWPIGPLFRSGGAFFIRRSFKGDTLYSLCLRKYVEYLLKSHYNVKFFIEGTRSRSGKMLPPAYGFLKMVMETYKHKVLDDVALVPVSICYDEVPEQGSYTKELAGAQKIKESAKDLIRSRNVVKRNIGKVYVRFASPLCVKDVYKGAEEMDQDDTLTLQKTAFQLCKSINDVTPITAKSLVSSVLLGHPEAALSLEEILQASSELGDYAKFSGSPLTVVELEDFKRSVEQTVKRLHKSGVLSMSEVSLPRTYSCEPRKRVLLNFYKNNAIHCFVIPCITSLAFFYSIEDAHTDSPALFFEKLITFVLKLRNILKFDFFFSPTPTFMGEIEKSFEFFFGPHMWKEKPVPILVKALEGHFSNWAHVSVYNRLLGEILESHLHLLHFLKTTGGASTFEKKALLQKVAKHAEGRSSRGELVYPESMSTQNYSNALLQYENLKFLNTVKEKDRTSIQFGGWTEAMETHVVQLTAFLELTGKNVESFLKQRGFPVSHGTPRFYEPAFPL